MRLSHAWIITSKEFKTFKKRAGIIYSIVAFVLLVSVGLPLLVRFIARKTVNVVLLPQFITAFSFLFVIGAALLPIGIAAYSFIGEKVQKSLEPLLATPTTDGEILLGKSLSAILPALGAIYLGAIIFTALIDILTYPFLNYYYFPNWDIVVILVLLAPLACILGVGYNILISSRVNDIRSAQQLGAVILLPLGAIYFLTEFKVITLETTTLLIIAAILAAVDVIVYILVKAAFQREEILTKWK